MSSSLFLRSSARFTARRVSAITTTTSPITKVFDSTTISNTNNFVRAFRNSTVKMGVHNVSSKAEFDAALKDNKVVILDAFATWCGPCKVIAPKVVEFSEKYPGAHFIKVDVDEVPDVASELGIRAMPTFLVFKDGEKVQEVVGANPNALEAACRTHAVEEAPKAE